MQELYKLKDKLTDELKGYAKKDISASSLTMIDTLAHSLKNIDKVIEKCEEEEGYSSMPSYEGGSMRGSSAYARRYSRDDSYARRRRDSMGRYARAGYSRDDDVAEELHDLMRNAPDERTRQRIQTIIDKMGTM